MASIAKLFGGFLLLASGLTIVFVSISRHLIELFILLGVVLVIIGLYLLVISFLNSGKTTKLQEFQKNLSNSKVNNSEEDSKNLLKSSNPNNTNQNINPSINKNNKLANKEDSKKPNIVSNLGNNLTKNKLAAIDTKKITEKVKDASKSKDPKSVLKPKNPKSNLNNKKFKFTPNYERPMKVNRRPKKRTKPGPNKNSIDLNNIEGGKSEAIAKALASDDFISPIHDKPKSKDNSTSDESIESKLKNIASKSKDSGPMDNNSIKKANDNINDINDLKMNNGQVSNDNNSLNNKSLDNDSLGNNSLVNNSLNNNSLGNDSLAHNDKELSKFLRSYVVCSKGTMTSKEAFEELAKNAKKEILLEMSSIKDMENSFFSKIASLNVRIVIEEFNIKDMSYVLLITSLLEQGIKIRTLPLINTINLIADDSHALIISETDSLGNADIGAVYNDPKSISNIKDMFEKSWNLANDLDINNLTGV